MANQPTPFEAKQIRLNRALQAWASGAKRPTNLPLSVLESVYTSSANNMNRKQEAKNALKAKMSWTQNANLLEFAKGERAANIQAMINAEMESRKQARTYAVPPPAPEIPTPNEMPAAQGGARRRRQTRRNRRQQKKSRRTSQRK